MKMLLRLIATAAVMVTAAALTATSAHAAMIEIYSNPLRSGEDRGQLLPGAGEQCQRGGNDRFMRARVGSEREACDFSPPVVGRDLGVSAVGAILSGTPREQRFRSYISASLRVGEGGSLKARVFPIAGGAQLVKTLPDGRQALLGAEREVPGLRGLGHGNRILLRAINTGEPGECRVVVGVNGRRALAVEDSRCPQLPGRLTAFGLGSTGDAEGVIAAFRSLRVRMPNPFDP